MLRVFLEKYAKAKCVVTQRLHAAMPCLALNTPVLLITEIAQEKGRLSGLKELARSCTEEEFLSGKVEFDFDNPPSNPEDYIPIREELIEKVSNWVKSQM